MLTALVVLNMDRESGAAPRTLQRWPGNSYYPHSEDCSQYMALLGTWQAASAALLYGTHRNNFAHGHRLYYISRITIFNDENDKHSMAVSISTVGPHPLTIGAISVLGLFPNNRGSRNQGGQQPQPAPLTNGIVNGVGHGGSVAGQGQQGPHAEPQTNGIVNGVGHGGSAADHGTPEPQAEPHTNGVVNGVGHGEAADDQ